MYHALVIEDQELSAKQVADLLREAGATSIDIAGTEEKAVSAALVRAPSIIVSDVKLAEGTGPGACERIRRRLGQIPVVFVTGSPEECGHCDYAAALIVKPATAHRLLDVVRHTIAGCESALPSASAEV